jgi:hypothetical protein
LTGHVLHEIFVLAANRAHRAYIVKNS